MYLDHLETFYTENRLRLDISKHSRFYLAFSGLSHIQLILFKPPTLGQTLNWFFQGDYSMIQNTVTLSPMPIVAQLHLTCLVRFNDALNSLKVI